MSNKKIKVPGYAQRVFFGNGIEYRNFSPDLVGFQIADDGGTPLFTMGNFAITTNMEPKVSKTFITPNYSNFVSLNDLNLDSDKTRLLLSNNAGVYLNLDKTDINYYALFGSLTEFVRVSLENIITYWPASLYMSPVTQSDTGVNIQGYTFQDYTYDLLTNSATFKINTTFINNNFNINYLKNAGTIISSIPNETRNISVNYSDYSILINNIEYPVIEFTGSTYVSNDFLNFKVQGNPFSGSTNDYSQYHIKPNKMIVDSFFNSLSEFEGYLLNRLVTPKYTATFNFKIKADTGIILHTSKSITWPTTDGYNIDFDSDSYVEYASNLLEISHQNDLVSSDLMYRFLVSTSISEFDTQPLHLSTLDQDTSGQKMTKSLRIYGRAFDEINNFIEGIAFANVVTYNKLNNTPDLYLKNLARVLGWELVSSVVENDLLSNYVNAAASTYSGQTVGLTPLQADIELWRRLILNSPWIWKSKGARKSVEFILRFIGIPDGLISFNEYVYKADAPINLDLFREVLLLNDLEDDLTLYPIDNDGYPSPLPDTQNMYFQNNGLWYRETGGSGSTIDILSGNNPHIGPYDSGFKYIKQFTELISNFSAVTVTGETISTIDINLFENYNLGNITNYSGETFVDAIYEDGVSLEDCYVVTTSVIPDPIPTSQINECGCNDSNFDDALSICLETGKKVGINCPPTSGPPKETDFGWFDFSYYSYDINGAMIYDNSGNPIMYESNFASRVCCKQSDPANIPMLYVQSVLDNIINTGYICCKAGSNCGCNGGCNWIAKLVINLPIYPSGMTGPQSSFLGFTRPDGSNVVVTPDGSNCITTGLNYEYMTPAPNMIDPISNEVGFGCKLTQVGLQDMGLGVNSFIYKFYKARYEGVYPCCGPFDLQLLESLGIHDNVNG